MIISFRIQLDHAVRARRNRGDGIKIDRRGEHATVIVVGMIADDLGSARRGDEQLRFASEVRAESLREGFISRSLILRGVKVVHTILIALNEHANIH